MTGSDWSNLKRFGSHVSICANRLSERANAIRRTVVRRVSAESARRVSAPTVRRVSTVERESQKRSVLSLTAATVGQARAGRCLTLLESAQCMGLAL